MPYKDPEKKRAWAQANPERVRATRRRYYEANREKVRARALAWARANPEVMRSHTRKWEQANPEPGRIRMAAYRAANPERLKEWKAANPDKVKTHRDNRRAARRLTPGHHTLAEWEECQQHFGRRCVYCRSLKGRMTKEHLLGLGPSGSNWVQDLAPACRACNVRKLDRSLVEFYRWCQAAGTLHLWHPEIRMRAWEQACQLAS